MSTESQAMEAAPPVSYTGGQHLDVAEVERELAELWRQAGEAAASSGQHAVTRACLWNLVVHDSGSGGPALPSSVVAAVPSRTIRLETLDEDRRPRPEQDVSASVSTLCNLSPGGGQQICSEEIRIEGYGEAGVPHFPALVRALLVPDLPVALLWLGSLPQKGRLLRNLMRLSDRVLIDTQPNPEQTALPQVNALVQDTHGWFVDLGWMRLAPVRHLIAGLFDPPGRAEQLDRLEAIRLVIAPGGRNSGFLLLGWLLSRLGAGTVGAIETAGQVGMIEGAGEMRWNADFGGRAVPISLVAKEAPQGEAGLDGLLELHIEADGERFTMKQLDALHVELDSPDHRGRKLALHGWDDPELIVAALGSPGIDALYPAALTMAANLIEAEAWNR